ncbi:MAG: flagellar basal body rod C-terminal domain-containing protein [Candidatus Baltobacteraceae bacterium]
MDGIAWAADAMSAAQSRLDTATQNLANASTDGFRKSRLRGFLSAAGIVLRRTPEKGQGPLRPTGRDLDLAITGGGAFRVRNEQGTVVQTRAGAFARDRFGRLHDSGGRVLMGTRGPLLFPDGAHFDPSGAVVCDGKTLDRLPLPRGSSLRTGFLESSNVDAIGEMIDVLTAQRSYETAQKVLTAIDQTRERSATQVAAVKG